MGMVMQGWGIFVVKTFKTRQDLSVEFKDVMVLILMQVILKSSLEPWSFKTELCTSYHHIHQISLWGFSLWGFFFSCKESTCNAGNLGSISGSGRFPGGGPGNSLQQFCLENPIDWGAWWAAVHQGSQRFGHDWVTGHAHMPLCDAQVVATR